jgi:hypothetical protein
VTILFLFSAGEDYLEEWRLELSSLQIPSLNQGRAPWCSVSSNQCWLLDGWRGIPRDSRETALPPEFQVEGVTILFRIRERFTLRILFCSFRTTSFAIGVFRLRRTLDVIVAGSHYFILLLDILLIQDLFVDTDCSLWQSSCVNYCMEITLSFFFGLSRIIPETYRITAIRRLAPVLGLLTLGNLGLTPVNADASLPLTLGEQQLTSVAAAPGGGFWVQVDQVSRWEDVIGDPNGETVAKDGAPGFENIPNRGSIAAIPGREGYWVVTPIGHIFNRGDAPQLCDGQLKNCSGFPNIPFTQFIVGAAGTPTGKGLWALGRDGKVWTAGDAQSYGDVQSDPQVPTGIAATPSGKGYYIVMEDGGVFSFGDAVFYGSTGGKRPGGHHLTGIALSIGDDGKVNGYWLIAEDGAVYTFGQAPFWGNAGITDWKVTSIVSFPAQVPGETSQRTCGYAWAFDNGEVRAVYGTSW